VHQKARAITNKTHAASWEREKEETGRLDCSKGKRKKREDTSIKPRRGGKKWSHNKAGKKKRTQISDKIMGGKSLLSVRKSGAKGKTTSPKYAPVENKKEGEKGYLTRKENNKKQAIPLKKRKGLSQFQGEERPPIIRNARSRRIDRS